MGVRVGGVSDESGPNWPLYIGSFVIELSKLIGGMIALGVIVYAMAWVATL